MASVTYLPPRSNRFPVQRYAHYKGAPAIATLVAGGYTVRVDGENRTHLAAFNDPALVLLGHVADADQQRRADEAAGGFAALVCGYGAGSR